MDVRDSVLNSIKIQLDIEPDDHSFDETIMLAANAAFATLLQMGVGPKEGFVVVGEEQQWLDFGEGAMYSLIPQYVYLKVRMVFDPPTNSFLCQVLESRISELEWRLYALGDGIFDGGINDE